jgi:hypothetical protein
MRFITVSLNQHARAAVLHEQNYRQRSLLDFVQRDFHNTRGEACPLGCAARQSRRQPPILQRQPGSKCFGGYRLAMQPGSDGETPGERIIKI